MARQVRNMVKNNYTTNIARILIIAMFMLLSWLAVDLIKSILDLTLSSGNLYSIYGVPE